MVGPTRKVDALRLLRKQGIRTVEQLSCDSSRQTRNEKNKTTNHFYTRQGFLDKLVKTNSQSPVRTRNIGLRTYQTSEEPILGSGYME